jgi:hypothetical protein
MVQNRGKPDGSHKSRSKRRGKLSASVGPPTRFERVRFQGAFAAHGNSSTLFLDVPIRVLFEHLVPIVLVLDHLLK